MELYMVYGKGEPWVLGSCLDGHDGKIPHRSIVEKCGDGEGIFNGMYLVRYITNKCQFYIDPKHLGDKFEKLEGDVFTVWPKNGEDFADWSEESRTLYGGPLYKIQQFDSNFIICCESDGTQWLVNRFEHFNGKHKPSDLSRDVKKNVIDAENITAGTISSPEFCKSLSPKEIASKIQHIPIITKVDRTRLLQCEAESKMSNCVKHSVGCIITDSTGVILSSGYNGTPSGHENCGNKFKEFAGLLKIAQDRIHEIKHEISRSSYNEALQHQLYGLKKDEEKLIMEHREWSLKNEIHAEVNAIMRADPIRRVGGTLYVNLQPCPNCAKMIASSGISRVIYGKKYHRADDDSSEQLFKSSGIEYIHLSGVLDEG